jgi:putative DNA primase/helicase
MGIEIAERDLQVCGFLHIRDNQPKTQAMTFAALAKRLATPKILKDNCRTPKKCGNQCLGKCVCPGVTGARFNGRRSKANVETLDFLCLDFDNDIEDPLPLQRIETALEAMGLRYILHTTLSHSEKRPKFRVLLELAEPIPAALYEKTMRFIVAMLADEGIKASEILGALDETLLKGSHVHQMYLVPAHREGKSPPYYRAQTKGIALTVPTKELLVELAQEQADNEKQKLQRKILRRKSAGTTGNHQVTEEVLEEIRRRVDLVDIAGEDTELRQVGNEFQGLCPLHQEDTPSFSVNPEKQVFHCFGCGAGGDLFAYLGKKTGRGFLDVVKDLASRAGISLPEVPRQRTVRQGRGKIVDIRRGGKSQEEPVPKEEVPEAILDHRLTEMANAELFAKEHGDHLRYCHNWNKWLSWNGVRWQVDGIGDAIGRAKETAAKMYQDATYWKSKSEEDPGIKRILRWVESSQQATRLKATMYLAQSEPGIPVLPEELDADHWSLTVKNGTLNLRTGKLKPHQRNDLVTKLVPATYKAEATCPHWMTFLKRVMDDDQELIQYLQRVVGYALTGSTREQCFFFFYGTGANGKSTFLDVIRELLGDYAQHMPTEALLTKSYATSGPTPEIARLKGVRYATAVEADAGRRLAESLIKQMTGGEPLAARFNRADTFEFIPTHKLFLAANHKPEIRGTDHAIWRRVHTIPFTVTIPDEEKDPELVNKLKKELSGILAWAVQGCLDWQRGGLQVPEAVLLATQEYRSEMDILGDYLEQRCLITPSIRIRTSLLYSDYERWCEEEHRDPVKHRTFSMRLKERGFKSTHGRTGNYWDGLALRD